MKIKIKKVKNILKPKEIIKKLDEIDEMLAGAKCQLKVTGPDENGIQSPRYIVLNAKQMIQNLMEELGADWS